MQLKKIFAGLLPTFYKYLLDFIRCLRNNYLIDDMDYAVTALDIG